MRAEEGDETLKDYAAEGEQALDKMKDSEREPSLVGRIVGRISKVFRGN
ncbi:hypothetical protein [Mycobacterium shigaense]|uniref:Uncharacterized protein n=1 Tax=Mycobacterium shigaense TaxID=722731 RepID=A0A1Z4ENU6_9MYCO|nr:hypothetical protein [Mycobacterium shigaense]MEA1122806.1 hypothetical protein [Mycobacterium shigaense]BAX94580.1 hypothetical protein MSG_04465 [Mycobacterium shigaense]